MSSVLGFRPESSDVDEDFTDIDNIDAMDERTDPRVVLNSLRSVVGPQIMMLRVAYEALVAAGAIETSNRELALARIGKVSSAPLLLNVFSWSF